jgi:hypothetical protein
VSTQLDQRDKDALRQCLEQGVSASLGRPCSIGSIKRTQLEQATAFRTEMITMQLDNGAELNVFLKDFGLSSLPKDNLPDRRERELRVYRDLLADAGLGTAKYYGAIWDRSRQRFWLLLEFVDGLGLRNFAFEKWVRAAAWLGRLGGHFGRQGDALATCDFLVRHDAKYFWSYAERALRAMSELSPAWEGRVATSLRDYEPLVDAMTSQPQTLVHGSFRPQNVLVTGGVNARVVAIDWELAALGPTLYDFAFLAHGYRSPKLDILWDAYGEEAAPYGLALQDRETMEFLVNCFCLHKVLKSLSNAAIMKFPEHTVLKLIAMGEELSNQCR